jgi:hypothetical protein
MQIVRPSASTVDIVSPGTSEVVRAEVPEEPVQDGSLLFLVMVGMLVVVCGLYGCLVYMEMKDHQRMEEIDEEVWSFLK